MSAVSSDAIAVVATPGRVIRCVTARAKARGSRGRGATGTTLGLVLALVLSAAVIGAARADGLSPRPARVSVGNHRFVVAASTPTAALPLAVDGDPISAVVPAGLETQAIYAVGGRGLYRSDDGGESWRAAGPPPPPGRIVAAMDDPLVLLAGSHPPCARGGGEEPPLYRSADGGSTWQTVEGVAGLRPWAVWGGENLALGSSCAGAQVSTDGGRTWRPVPITDAGYEVTAFAPLAGATGAAPAGLVGGTSEGGTGGVWLLDLADPARPARRGPLTSFWGAGAPAGRGRLFVVGTATGVLLSSDAGGTWRQSRRGLEEVTLSVDPFQEPIPDEQLRRGFGIGAVAINPDLGDHLYAGTVGGLYQSTDGGATWRRTPGVDGLVTRLVLAPGGERLLAETKDGVVVVPLGIPVA